MTVLCRSRQHLPQHTQAQSLIDQSGVRLNSKLVAQTVVCRAVVMWRELTMRAKPSSIFQEVEDSTRCFESLQPACRATVDWLNMHLVPTRGRGLGYFVHAPAKNTAARLSQTSQNVRMGGFAPLFFSLTTTP